MNKILIKILLLGFVLTFYSCMCKSQKEEYWKMKGVILDVHDLSTINWPKLAADNGINTIGTHVFPGQVANFARTEKGKDFFRDCEKYGIDVEHQLHSIRYLLPRNLFEEHPEWFRMNAEGNRVADYNCCVHSQDALNIISKNALKCAQMLPSTNHRYYFWLDDGAPICECPFCKNFSASEQALIIENKIIEILREIDPDAQLAHLAYQNTIEPPIKVKPSEGVFLEFAPFFRRWDKPLSDLNAFCIWSKEHPMTHADNLELLKENLKIFPVQTAMVLEYWLDVSLFSSWKKPAVQLPWNKEVFESDIETYADLGIRNITSFAVYMDSAYFRTYPDLTPLKEYGIGLSSFEGNN